MPAAPSVAVLCTRQRGPALASAVALALAHASGHPCALAAAVGTAAAPGPSLTPASLRAAARLRRDGFDVGARGRLVWLADRRGTLGAAPAPAHDGERQGGASPGPEDVTPGDTADAAGATAALSAELRRAAGLVAGPCALTIPFSRSDALDRVLGWHDAIVVVREPGASAAITGRVLASVRRLGRPAVVLEPPRRLAAAAAGAGLHVPAFAVAAVAELGLGRSETAR